MNKINVFVRMNRIRHAVIFLIIIFAFYACTSAEKLSYFQNLPDAEEIILPPIQTKPRSIEAGDNIYINFSAKDNEAARFFNKGGGNTNMPVTSASNPTGLVAATSAPGGGDYIVSSEGIIEFPILGKLKVTGITDEQLQQQLTTLVTPYLKEPIVDVRFNNFRFTVIGEVRSPGIHTLPMQRTTLFEALASAGDLPLSAQRYDITLYRDNGIERKIIKVDLRDAAILNNPEIFQIRHNDVLYVKPRSSAVFREEVTFVTSMVSLVVGILTFGIALYSSNN